MKLLNRRWNEHCFFVCERIALYIFWGAKLFYLMMIEIKTPTKWNHRLDQEFVVSMLKALDRSMIKALRVIESNRERKRGNEREKKNPREGARASSCRAIALKNVWPNKICNRVCSLADCTLIRLIVSYLTEMTMYWDVACHLFEKH